MTYQSILRLYKLCSLIEARASERVPFALATPGTTVTRRIPRLSGETPGACVRCSHPGCSGARDSWSTRCLRAGDPVELALSHG
jgi:hypothetical protein